MHFCVFECNSKVCGYCVDTAFNVCVVHLLYMYVCGMLVPLTGTVRDFVCSFVRWLGQSFSCYSWWFINSTYSQKVRHGCDYLYISFEEFIPNQGCHKSFNSSIALILVPVANLLLYS